MQSVFLPTRTTKIDGKKATEYIDSAVLDKALKEVLRQAYIMYKV
jgi:hypothetical protein